jgi:plasmid stability protein
VPASTANGSAAPKACALPLRYTPHSIQIRHVPEGVHRTLRARAAAAGLSLSDYLLEDITRLAEGPPQADVIRRASSRSGGAEVELIVEAVRSGRDRR